MPIRRLVVAGLAFVAALLLALARALAPGGEAVPAVERAPTASPAAPPGRVALDDTGLDAGALARLDDLALAAQIRRVVESFDRTGRPPAGVVQGGRRRGARGVFLNAEGALPRRAPGYYTESDVWPRGARGRGALRLVFGRGREVYFTSDHYRSFTTLRHAGAR